MTMMKQWNTAPAALYGGGHMHDLYSYQAHDASMPQLGTSATLPNTMTMFHNEHSIVDTAAATGASADYYCYSSDTSVPSILPHSSRRRMEHQTTVASRNKRRTTNASDSSHSKRTKIRRSSSRKGIEQLVEEEPLVFVQGILCPRYLQNNDRVMISIPEDMMIHGQVPAHLHGRVGRVVLDSQEQQETKQHHDSQEESNLGDFVEIPVEIQMNDSKKKKRKNRSSGSVVGHLMDDYQCPESDRNTTMVVHVPVFCLCLPSFILKERMALDGLDCTIE